MPGALVVKEGSKIRERVASSIPTPVSVMASMTYNPGATSGWSRA
jgi:hypothetical protein